MDRDNDIHPDKSCAELRGKGGNWYYGEETSPDNFKCLGGSNNLNGLYGQLDPDAKLTVEELKPYKDIKIRTIASMNWSKFTGGKYVPLKSATYMVRDC